MILQKETIYNVDHDNKKIRVTREFDAQVSKVWKAWTEPELLDQWWAPRPWKAVTQSMDFREGGVWRYYMEGPEGERHYCRVDYERISNGKEFSGHDAFCDENGDITSELPRMHWSVTFNGKDAATQVEAVISFATVEDLEKIVEMGFKEGFAAAHNNLDELLAAQA